eukprot:COSAG02_NODE_9314_length_2258_cov_2.900880_3_plen_80_part_01
MRQNLAPPLETLKPLSLRPGPDPSRKPIAAAAAAAAAAGRLLLCQLQQCAQVALPALLRGTTVFPTEPCVLRTFGHDGKL